MKQPKQIDAVIVGGGPAGLAAAVALLTTGLRTSSFWSGKPSWVVSCANVSTTDLV